MKTDLKLILTSCVAALSVAAFAGCGGNGSNGDNNGAQNGNDGSAYGTVAIDDVTVYINSNNAKTFAELEPVFSKPDKAESLTYVYDNTMINIDNGIVTPKKKMSGTINVQAKSDNFNTLFKVNVEYVNYSSQDVSDLYLMSKSSHADAGQVEGRRSTCAAITENTTLFIGDSFMDSQFIGEYMTEYSTNKDVLNAGINSTTSYHWEKEYSYIIGTTAPKNIAIHIGTNNFYDEHDLVDDTVESLKRLFMYMHDSYPATNIYWFNISQRANTDYAERVAETNTTMSEWCAEYDWITCVDTCSKLTVGMLRDGTHPTTENYHIFTDALVEAGCVIEAKA